MSLHQVAERTNLEGRMTSKTQPVASEENTTATTTTDENTLNKERTSQNADITENGDSANQAQEDLQGEESDNDDVEEGIFLIKKILNTKLKKMKNGQEIRYYKVRWSDSWEPEKHLTDCQKAIDEFWRNWEKEKEKETDQQQQQQQQQQQPQPQPQQQQKDKNLDEVTEDPNKGYNLRKSEKERNRKRRFFCFRC